ncbi:MAG: penicillin-binding protein 1C [Bacteroidales bacterium]|nr:penicillin-binding protein 1C [Bacteroidales bacterium]MCB8999807.1 penicillin-binding protein 1C [Bacteroidales bacterium]
MRKKIFIFLAACFVSAGIWFIFCLPDPLFSDPYSTVLRDRNNDLLGARIADDGQWRFPEGDSLPYKYKKAVILFEDKYFYRHPGVNPVSLFKALKRNLSAGKTVSGGSTISMQVIRLSRKGKPRTIYQKLVEIIFAFRMELSYTKDEILNLYASHAPFGGNVVGIEAASWRYFGRNSNSLSWSEAAMLAVLPNSPALVHPGRNRTTLRDKRNRLLVKLFNAGELDSLSLDLAMDEPLPDSPYPLPQLAANLLDYYYTRERGVAVRTSIDKALQEKLERLLAYQIQRLSANQIHNIACIITDVRNHSVLAYVGNIKNPAHPEYGGDVDVILSPRSSGSILKPILFAEMLQRGNILPGTLVPDIPTMFGSFSPKNYNRGYEGAVPANIALSKSLNVPAVRMLKDYGIERFYHDLKRLGMKTLNYPSDRYGLSLILGGAEARLWDLAAIYSGFARTVVHYTESSGKYFENDFDPPSLLYRSPDSINTHEAMDQGVMGAGAVYITLKSLLEVNRPDEEIGWEYFSSSRRIAWKTGTSFGFRDAWAIGVTPEFTVAVWTGNANGEGRPGLTGRSSSAPVLFEVFSLLPKTSWFKVPYDDLVTARVCSQSGQLAGEFCPESDSVLIPEAGLQTRVCEYHHLIHLDRSEKYRVNSECYKVENMHHMSWFVLPPVEEWYYKKQNANYKSLPPMLAGCKDQTGLSPMQMVYPEPGSVVYVPYELDGTKGRLICEAIHRKAGVEIFWHLDETYLGKTKGIHQMAILPGKGKHTLSLIDSDGFRISVIFEAIERKH